jgi:hypothetical protein
VTTTVNISGTFSEKQKSNNGLTEVADLIRHDRTVRVPIVGWVEYHQWTEKLTGDVLTVAIPVIESCLSADGNDPHGWAEAVMDMIDERRKERGLGKASEVPMHTGELTGQIGFDFDGPADEPTAIGEVRLTGDGPREVPPPSGDEIVAEREEAKAAKGKAKPSVTPFVADGAV